MTIRTVTMPDDAIIIISDMENGVFVKKDISGKDASSGVRFNHAEY